ncbi:MAG: hypothetical protein R2769_07275 [Saprospiraceae bacterium]
MTLQEVMKELELRCHQKTLMRHGAREPFFGVKVADLKKILKKTKKNHQLSLNYSKPEIRRCNVSAGLMADERNKLGKRAQQLGEKAYWSYLSE